MSDQLRMDRALLREDVATALESLQHLLLLNPVDVAAALDDDGVHHARRMLRDMQEWSDRFEAEIGDVSQDAP